MRTLSDSCAEPPKQQSVTAGYIVAAINTLRACSIIDDFRDGDDDAFRVQAPLVHVGIECWNLVALQVETSTCQLHRLWLRSAAQEHAE